MIGNPELRELDLAINSKLGSDEVQRAIKDVVKIALLESIQKSQVDISTVAESVCNQFKADFKAGLTQFTDDWVDNNGVLEVVPHGTKLYKTMGNYKLVVVEQTPSVRTLSFDNARRTGGGTGDFSLALPYVVFICTISPSDRMGYVCSYSVAYAKKPLTSVKSLIYPTNLPNSSPDIGVGARVCMGSGWDHQIQVWQVEGRRFTLAESVEEAIKYFWNSVFNNDMPEAWMQGVNTDDRISSLAKWAKNTADNPLFMLDVNWPRGKHLKDAIAASIASDEVRLQFGPIIERAVRHAGDQLSLFSNRLNGQITTSNRAFGQLRTKLYDFMFKTCSDLINSAVIEREKTIKQKLEKEFESRRPSVKQENKLQKVARYEGGDYMYRAPEYEVW